MPEAVFSAFLGGIFEKTPWIIVKAAEGRPYRSKAALLAAMTQVLDQADERAQLALLQAHPVLGGEAARRGEMTLASRVEQAGLGLDRLEGDEEADFAALNQAYQQRFGFPFIIAVKGQRDRGAILAALRRRFEATPQAERQAALAEVVKIAGFRLDALVDDVVLT